VGDVANAPRHSRGVGIKEDDQMKKLVVRNCCVVAILAIINVASGADSVEVQLKKMADETRKSLPMMMNEDLQSTSIAAVGKILLLRYNFTKKKAQLDVPALKAEYYTNSLNAASTNPDTQKALRNGVSFEYQYYDSVNEFVMQYTIDAKTCNLKK